MGSGLRGRQFGQLWLRPVGAVVVAPRCRCGAVGGFDGAHRRLLVHPFALLGFAVALPAPSDEEREGAQGEGDEDEAADGDAGDGARGEGGARVGGDDGVLDGEELGVDDGDFRVGGCVRRDEREDRGGDAGGCAGDFGGVEGVAPVGLISKSVSVARI